MTRYLIVTIFLAGAVILSSSWLCRPAMADDPQQRLSRLHKEMRPVEVIEPRILPEATKSRDVVPEHSLNKRYFPTAGHDKYYGDDRIFEASPADQAVFRMGSIVTIIWHKAIITTGTGGRLENYQVLIQSDLGFNETYWTKPSEDQTFINFRPPAPAHYSWQVIGHMNGGGITASMGRGFQVLP